MSDTPARLSVDVGDGGSLSATGDIDAHSAPELSENIGRLTAPDATIRLDLSQVEFIDSSGLRVIIDAQREVAATGGHLVLVRPSRAVMRVLEISGLTDHLEIEG